MDYPFEIKVYIYTRPNLRDPSLEFELQMGRNVLESMFDKLEQRPDITSLFLAFPENHLNLVEQRQLYDRCQHYLPNLKKLEIKTHSVHIIQCTSNNSAYMMDDASTCNDHSPITERLYNDMAKSNLFNIEKLNVI